MIGATRVVSFYSFKGGVGRSLSLANVAVHLSANQGQRVGVLDLDIEAGGLHQIFRVEVPKERDLLALLMPQNRDVAQVEQYVLEVQTRKRQKPQMFLIPTVADSCYLDEIPPWSKATEDFLHRALLPEFCSLYKLDFLLIDCRSGLAQPSVFPLQIADLEILLCRLDRQNEFGMARMVEVCRAASKPYRVVVVACPESDKKKKALRRFQRVIGGNVSHVLPYESSLYFEERIISKEDPVHPLAQAYEKLTLDIRGELP